MVLHVGLDLGGDLGLLQEGKGTRRRSVATTEPEGLLFVALDGKDPVEAVEGPFFRRGVVFQGPENAGYEGALGTTVGPVKQDQVVHLALPGELGQAPEHVLLGSVPVPPGDPGRPRRGRRKAGTGPRRPRNA